MAEKEVQELSIKVKVDYDKRTVEVVNANIGKLTEKIKTSSKETDKSKVSFKELTNAIGLTGLTIGGVIGAFKFFTDTLKKGIQAAIENEVAMSKLAFRLKTLGEKDIQGTINSLDNFAQELSKLTIFEKTEVVKALETLIKYTGNVASAQKLLITATKLATAEHKGLSEVVYELGTAIAMPEYGMRRLRREYGSLVGDAKNVTEALENISENLSKQKDLLLTSEQRYLKLGKIWREDIVEKAGVFWLNVLNKLGEQLIKLGSIVENAFDRLGNFLDKTIGRVIRGLSMSTRMLDEYEKQAAKIAEKEKKRTQDKIKGLDDFEKQFKDVQIKVTKEEERTAEKLEEAKKKAEDKITEYLLKRRADTLEGTKELLDKEVEEFKKAGVKKELIEQYYQERLKEIQSKQSEERQKIEEKLKDEIAKIKGETYERARELLERELEEYRRIGIDKELLTQYEASRRIEIEKQMYDEIEKMAVESFQKQWGWASDMLNSITNTFTQSMVELVDTGENTADKLGEVWERIKKSFINALVAMVAEYMAKMAIIGAVSLITGGPFSLVARGLGFFGLQEGGIVKKPTVALIGEKEPEAVVPLSKAPQIGFGQQINLSINAFDLRTISQQQIERFAKQIKHVLNKELKR